MKKLLLLIFGCGFITLISLFLYYEITYKTQILEKQKEIEDQQIMLELKKEKPKKIIFDEFNNNGDYFFSVSSYEKVNQELQIYHHGYSKIRDNNITLIADKINDLYVSGKVETKISFRYGRFSFKIPPSLTKKGLFPAIWMLPQEIMKLPEVDIFEMIGSEPNSMHTVMHYDDQGQRETIHYLHTLSEKQKEEGFILTFDWHKDRMDWFVDGEWITSIKEHVPQDYMYMIFNLAIGGIWPGNPSDDSFPTSFGIEVLEFSPRDINER